MRRANNGVPGHVPPGQTRRRPVAGVRAELARVNYDMAGVRYDMAVRRGGAWAVVPGPRMGDPPPGNTASTASLKRTAG